jgi:hypothetical protein
MYDPRNTLAQNVAAELEKHFGDKLYRTVIPRNVRLAEAPSHGLPAMKLEQKSKGALAYLALAGEMIRRMEARGLPTHAAARAPAPASASDVPPRAPDASAKAADSPVCEAHAETDVTSAPSADIMTTPPAPDPSTH